MKGRSATILLLAGLLPGSFCQAQVTVHHAEASERDSIEVASPMVVEVSLAATPKHAGLVDHDEKSPIVFSDMRRYVCDKARVTTVQAWHTKERGDKVRVKIVTSLSTEWTRQDLNVEVSLIDPAGKSLGHRAWRDFTIGGTDNFAARVGAVWASRPKSIEAEFVLGEKEFKAMFEDGKAPTAKITVEISQ